MIASDLYDHLEKDFHLSLCRDDWSEMDIGGHMTKQYSERYMGLVIDNTDAVGYVYTAVFPSSAIVGKALHNGHRGTLLFVHHPMAWDIRHDPIFTDISPASLQAMKECGVSMYNLHVPLDAIGPYGTTSNFAAALGIRPVEEFLEYGGVKVGIIGETDYASVRELKQKFDSAVGHETALYPYGGEEIAGGRVGLVAGGGNMAEVYPFLRDRGVNTYLTGIASMRTGYQPAVDAHRAAEECGVSILAGTHYSTEKFACMKMVEYFASLGLPGEFIPDVPCMEDM